MSDNYNSLKGFGVIPSEILFNEDGFSIQRQFYILYSNIAVSVLLILSSTAYIISAVSKELYNWFFYSQITFVFLLAIALIVLLYLLFYYRKRNKRTYNFKHIKRFEESKRNVYVHLSFECSDNSKDKIILYWNTKSRDFITFLKTKVEGSE